MYVGILAVIALVALMLILIAAYAWRAEADAGSYSSQWRAVLTIRVLFLILGLAVGASLIASDSARTMMAGPAAAGYILIFGVFIGEIVIRSPRPKGIRSAGLTARSVQSYVDRSSARDLLILLVLHLCVLAFTTAVAVPDELGDAGRAIGYSNGDFSTWGAPFPGSYYSTRLVLLAVGLVLLAGIAVVRVVRRPRGYSDDVQVEEAMRTSSVATIAGALGVSLAISHVGVAGVATMQLLSLARQNTSADGVEIAAPGWFLPAGIVVGLTLVWAIVVGFKLGAHVIFPRKEVATHDIVAA